MALETTGQFPRCLKTTPLWEIFDWDSWHIHAQDLNEGMLHRLHEIRIEDLKTPGDAYLRYGQHSPLLINTRLDEINYNQEKTRVDRSASEQPLHVPID
ncbi:hypothetical protein EVAR_6044_1 [Eumeta japonica]|uniref:Uncharacterized protein n=1 Tax=Eumeta variegata TaxID=151549 RepID=A0A4C1TD48_EUMVA|nr:hypothetical protein EVAR_6044_1 [Eumeta japonica]